MSMEDAVRLVRRGDRVIGGLPEPCAFFEALAARDDLGDVEVFLGAPRNGGVAIATNPGCTLYAGFLTEAVRAAKVRVEVTDWCFRVSPKLLPALAAERVGAPAEPTDEGVVYRLAPTTTNSSPVRVRRRCRHRPRRSEPTAPAVTPSSRRLRRPRRTPGRQLRTVL
jgi:hypothetical protein